MSILILGLIIFLGAHSVRVFADSWRTAQIERLGAARWKNLYTVVSLIGFALLIWGYAMTRGAAPLWQPPAWTRHLAALLTIPAFILITAAYVPRNRIKAALGHPMVAGIKIWAFAHLIANGRFGDVLLFGAFLVWAVVLFATSRRRDRTGNVRYPAGTMSADMQVVVIGLVIWVLFAFFLHAWLIGVQPFVRGS